MQNPLNPSSIKNIFWDVDGVLADLNHAYYHFLTGLSQLGDHPPVSFMNRPPHPVE